MNQIGERSGISKEKRHATVPMNCTGRFEPSCPDSGHAGAAIRVDALNEMVEAANEHLASDDRVPPITLWQLQGGARIWSGSAKACRPSTPSVAPTGHAQFPVRFAP